MAWVVQRQGQWQDEKVSLCFADSFYTGCLLGRRDVGDGGGVGVGQSEGGSLGTGRQTEVCGAQLPADKGPPVPFQRDV